MSDGPHRIKQVVRRVRFSVALSLFVAVCSVIVVRNTARNRSAARPAVITSSPDAGAPSFGVPYHFAPEAVEVLCSVPLRKMAAAGHGTSWWHGHYGGERRGRFFVFFTVDDETAYRVETLLSREGLLCSTPLDDVPVE